jgi:hypothetical protein
MLLIKFKSLSKPNEKKETKVVALQPSMKPKNIMVMMILVMVLMKITT